LNWEFLRWLKCLEPCGQGNPSPIFMARDLRVTSKRQIGKDGAHLKMTLSDGHIQMQAIAFGFGAIAPDLGPVVHVAFALEENNYYGRELQMRIIDIHAGGRE
jgi:single-stranded-DNA-specific exonuclease